MMWLLVGFVMAWNIKKARSIRNEYFTGPVWANNYEKGHAKHGNYTSTTNRQG